MNRFAGIRAVTFDVGSTLIEPWPSVGHVYAEVAAAHGHGNLSTEELNQRFFATLRNLGGVVNTKLEWARIVDVTFAGLLPEPPSGSFFPELYERFARKSAWRIYDDVAPVVAALSQRGLKLGVISNWDDRLRPLLESLNLADLFETVVVSCEVGVSKPASAIFEAAVKMLGVPAAAILHVGDNFEMDVQGARAAGLNAVQIKREANQGDGINSLLDLLSLV